MTSKLFSNILRPRLPSYILKRCESSEKRLIVYDPFANQPEKDKKTYLKAIKIFEGKDNRRRGHVEFIYAALGRMKEFGVHKDLDAYKALVDVLPKGKMISQNIFQAEFMHYPKQQQCAVDLLEQMEDNKVIPDSELETQLLNVFGRRGIPLRKLWRMLYWMPKFKNLSPWYLPDKLPDETLELAKIAIDRITSVDSERQISVWQTEEIEASLDKTWIVSSQSPMQMLLLEQQPEDEPLVIKGPYDVYLRDQTVTYFLLFGKIKEDPKDDTDIDDVSNIEKPPGIPGYIGKTELPALKCTVHEQDDGTVLGACATGTSSRDSLLSWIRLLEKNGNPLLGKVPVIFTLIAPPSEMAVPETQPATTEQKDVKSN